MIQQQRVVKRRQQQRQKEPQHPHDAQKAAVLPAQRMVVRRVQKGPERAGHRQRIGRAVAEHHRHAVGQKAGRAVGALGLHDLRQQLPRIVLDELLELPDGQQPVDAYAAQAPSALRNQLPAGHAA